MLSESTPAAFIPSTDLERSRAFYEGVLGLTVTALDGFALQLDCNGLRVRVTHIGPKLNERQGTVFGWRVGDIHQAIADLTSNGIEFNRYDGLDQDEHGVWTAPGGTQIAWFSDPDGNTLSLDTA